MRSRSGAAAGVRTGVLAGLVVAGLLASTSCTSDSGATRAPTVPSVDFTPKLVLEVDDGGFRWRRGDRNDPAVTIDPAAVPFGTVIQVVNTGKKEHEVDAGKGFDTGRLQPGDTTTVAFTAETLATVGASAQTYQIVDRDDPTHTTTIVVTPKASTA